MSGKTNPITMKIRKKNFLDFIKFLLQLSELNALPYDKAKKSSARSQVGNKINLISPYFFLIPPFRTTKYTTTKYTTTKYTKYTKKLVMRDA
jgi:hypothetical protein